MENMKIGLDIHGVIDTDPAFFSKLSWKMQDAGHKVYVITGEEISGKLLHTLVDTYNIYFERLLSITSYHLFIGTYVTYADEAKTQPLIAPPKWDRTKAILCKSHGIDIHIDDSKVYGKYFGDIPTQYILYNESLRAFLDALLK
jgi:hypothetical protein